MDIVISDWQDQKFAYSAREVAEYINAQAFVVFYDGAQIAHDNEMHPLDWAVSTLLSAPIRRYSALETLWKNDKELLNNCNKALAALAPSVSLEHDDSQLLRPRIEAAFTVFMKPTGIGSSIAAKTLHKKRPQLIPVIDDYVSTVLSGVRGYDLSPKSITDVIFDRFRPQLVVNLPAIHEVESLLRETPYLSPVRILDIVIWRHADKHQDVYKRVYYTLGAENVPGTLPQMTA